ncbi:MAG: energy transducer TonB [Acidobacteriaceae bacterium]|nr:energy transducer TonB [Acidobacteriaceae bacterium]
MRTFALFALMFAVIPCSSQTTPTEFDQGVVTDNTYNNPALGVTWAAPTDWTMQSTGASRLGDGFKLLVRVVPTGTQSPEAIELDHSNGTATSPLSSVLESKGWESSSVANDYYTIAGGIPARRSDYKMKDGSAQYLSLLRGRHHGDVTMAFFADSRTRIDELIKMVMQMKVRPDWGRFDEGPGAVPKRVRVSSGVSRGFLVHQVKPIYPKEALRSRINGVVMMLAHISTDGSIKNLFVMFGNPALNQAALDAVSKWKYQPYFLNGSPVEVETEIVVNFTTTDR